MGGGTQIDGKKLQDLSFADDIILFATSAEELGRDLQEQTQQSKAAGLKLNPQKTKLMTNSTEDTIKVNNTELQYVNEYTYLRQYYSIKSHAMKSNSAFPNHGPNSGALNLSLQALHIA